MSRMRHDGQFMDSLATGCCESDPPRSTYFSGQTYSCWCHAWEEPPGALASSTCAASHHHGPAGAAARNCRRSSLSLALALSLYLVRLNRAQAEDQVAYRYENYQEDDNRIKVETHSGLFDKKITPWLTLKGQVVYDAISGATPTGAPPPNQIHFVPPDQGGPSGPDRFNPNVPLTQMDDVRWAGSADIAMSFGAHHITPQFSYSHESDYISKGGAITYSVDLNEKNTTLNAGWSHNWDRLKGSFVRTWQDKQANDVMVGVNQLLSPQTVLTVNFTYGYGDGYLADPYKGVLFDNVPQFDPISPALDPEKRPYTRNRYIPYVSVTQYINPLHGSLEASYRFFQDSWGITANTLALTWYQKIGKHVVIAPEFRYYRQSAADFYTVSLPNYDTRPAYYSADYRLSEMQTFVGGVGIHVKVCDHFGLDASYKRYVMQGLDSVTSPSAYPSANAFTIGARVWF
jgi:hypothetical protein